MSAPKIILVLAANPLGTSTLQLDEEVKEIREAIREARQFYGNFLPNEVLPPQ